MLSPNRTVLATLVTSAFGSGFSECALSASAVFLVEFGWNASGNIGYSHCPETAEAMRDEDPLTIHRQRGTEVIWERKPKENESDNCEGLVSSGQTWNSPGMLEAAVKCSQLEATLRDGMKKVLIFLRTCELSQCYLFLQSEQIWACYLCRQLLHGADSLSFRMAIPKWLLILCI